MEVSASFVCLVKVGQGLNRLLEGVGGKREPKDEMLLQLKKKKKSLPQKSVSWRRGRTPDLLL